MPLQLVLMIINCCHISRWDLSIPCGHVKPWKYSQSVHIVSSMQYPMAWQLVLIIINSWDISRWELNVPHHECIHGNRSWVARCSGFVSPKSKLPCVCRIRPTILYTKTKNFFLIRPANYKRFFFSRYSYRLKHESTVIFWCNIKIKVHAQLVIPYVSCSIVLSFH